MNLDAASLRMLVAAFTAEATEIVERLTLVILDLEGGTAADPAEYFAELGRGLHTLKGTAGSIGLGEVAVVAHELETVFAPAKKQGAMPAGVADELLKGLDRLLSMVREASRVDSGEESAPVEPEEPEAIENTELGWRVSPRQIRELMREVERMRNLRMRLAERRRKLIELAGRKDVPERELVAALNALARSFGADGEELADVTNSVEGGIKDIWTLPARVVLEPLHRIVRDLCRETGKQAKLSFVGDGLALDRRVLEALKGPFVHLVRNAIDHGIETPGVRRQKGKHEAGALAIRLEQQGNILFVEVSDDGGGIDHERVRNVAFARGVAPEADLAHMTESQLAQLIFKPGFSTRDNVSATSGRGVGLDVVMTEVRALQGHLEVQSTPGQGTRFLLSVPIELGSSAILVVRCGDQRFGVPMLATESVVAIRAPRLQIGRTRMRLIHADQTIPLISLSVLLGLAHPSPPKEGQPALIVQSQTERFALVVDEVIGENDVVIRPLPQEQREIPAYQGVATVATGELLLVLREGWFAEAWRGEQAPIAASRRALVVDDSVTARALHRAVLEAAGWTVHAVGSAKQALEHLARAAYDVVVCDIAMPEVNGYEFTRAMRARPEGTQTPVILVSAHDAEQDRALGLAAGADAFLSKRECASGRLLAEVSRVASLRKGAA